MDRSKMLIQQLALASGRGEDNSVLLAMVEEIRNELAGTALAAPAAENVAVVLPNGFRAREASSQGVSPVAAPARRPGLSVPRPPVVIAVEEDPEPAIPAMQMQLQETESHKAEVSTPEPHHAASDEHENSGDQARPILLQEQSPWMPRVSGDQPAPPAPAEHDAAVKDELHNSVSAEEWPQTAAPLTLELPLTPDMIAEAVALEMESEKPPAAVGVGPAFLPVTPEAAPHDLNEKMAQRNKMLNEVFARPEPDLAAVLAAPRINDLRKAISINEKYQFINTLFRGDEDMFERSIKTLNNFQVMQEANYWMQRELLIKLGWNDEDELVQRFFELVSRRFS